MPCFNPLEVSFWQKERRASLVDLLCKSAEPVRVSTDMLLAMEGNPHGPQMMCTTCELFKDGDHVLSQRLAFVDPGVQGSNSP